MTNSFQDGFLRDSNGNVVVVDSLSATAPVDWLDGFLRDATGALVVTGESGPIGGGGGGTAATTTFDPTGLNNTSATDVQDALDNFDSAISANAAQAANSRGDLFQNETTLAWPANPGDGRSYDWHGAGHWIGDWVSGGPSGGYLVGDGVNGPSGNAGVWVCTAANTDATFTPAHWALLDMHQWDRLELA